MALGGCHSKIHPFATFFHGSTVFKGHGMLKVRTAPALLYSISPETIMTLSPKPRYGLRTRRSKPPPPPPPPPKPQFYNPGLPRYEMPSPNITQFTKQFLNAANSTPQAALPRSTVQGVSTIVHVSSQGDHVCPVPGLQT